MIFHRKGRVELEPPISTLNMKPANISWLVSEARTEYDLLTRTLESLDTKLAALIAFVGVLLALPIQIALWPRIVGSIFAMGSGLIALLAFSPKPFPIVDSLKLYENHGSEDISALQGQTFGSLENAIFKIKVMIDNKAKHLTRAGWSVLLSTISYGIGSIYKMKGGK